MTHPFQKAPSFWQPSDEAPETGSHSRDYFFFSFLKALKCYELLPAFSTVIFFFTIVCIILFN